MGEERCNGTSLGCSPGTKRDYLNTSCNYLILHWLHSQGHARTSTPYNALITPRTSTRLLIIHSALVILSGIHIHTRHRTCYTLQSAYLHSSHWPARTFLLFVIILHWLHSQARTSTLLITIRHLYHAHGRIFRLVILSSKTSTLIVTQMH